VQKKMNFEDFDPTGDAIARIKAKQGAVADERAFDQAIVKISRSRLSDGAKMDIATALLENIEKYNPSQTGSAVASLFNLISNAAMAQFVEIKVQACPVPILHNLTCVIDNAPLDAAIKKRLNDVLAINASKVAPGASKGEPCPRLVQAMLPLMLNGQPDLIEYVVSQINMCTVRLMTPEACVEYIGSLGQRQLSGQSQVKILAALTANQRK